jgi:hypothetical protein
MSSPPFLKFVPPLHPLKCTMGIHGDKSTNGQDAKYEKEYFAPSRRLKTWIGKIGATSSE